MSNQADNFSGLGTSDLNGRVSSSGDTWSVILGSFAGDGNTPIGVACINLDSTPPYFKAMAILGTTMSSSIYSVAIKQKSYGVTNPRSFCVVARYADGNFIQAAFNASDNTYDIYEFFNGNFNLLGNGGGTNLEDLIVIDFPDQNHVQLKNEAGNIILGPFVTTITNPGRVGVVNYGASATSNGVHLVSFSVNSNYPVLTPTLTLTPSIATVLAGATISFVANLTNSTSSILLANQGGQLSTNTPANNVPFTLTVPSLGTGICKVFATAGSLTQTAVVDYTTFDPPVTITVDSLASNQSPGNWSGNSNRVGNLFRQSWNNGSYRRYSWNTPSNNPSAKLLLSNSTSGSTISYFINGTFVSNINVPSDSSGINLTNLNTGDNELIYFLRSSSQVNRWNLSNSVKDSGLIVDPDSTLNSLAYNNQWVMIVGDSLSEGIQANNGQDDFLSCYTFALTQSFIALGYECGISACGFSGWLRPGDSTEDVPSYYPLIGQGRWNQLNATTSLLDTSNELSAYGSFGSTPNLILFNYGTNECLSASSVNDMESSIVLALTNVRLIAPATKLVVLVPFGLYSSVIFPTGLSYVNAVKQAFENYKTAFPLDTNVTLLDLGASVSKSLESQIFGAGVHPNQNGHSYIASLLTPTLIKILTTPAPEFVTITTSVSDDLTVFQTVPYISFDQANVYFNNKLNTSPWDCSSYPAKLKALIEATEQIDRLNFIGRKASPKQKLQWPRIVHSNREAIFPIDIQKATAELALNLLDGIDPDLEDDLLSSQSDAYATVRVTSDSTLAKDHIKAGIVSVTAWRLLLPWLNDPRSIHLRKG